MKKTIALMVVAGGLLIAGCCSVGHVTQWEYKVEPYPLGPQTGVGSLILTNGPSPVPLFTPSAPLQASDVSLIRSNNLARRIALRQDFLNGLGKEGWILVYVDVENGYYYFKRPVK